MQLLWPQMPVLQQPAARVGWAVGSACSGRHGCARRYGAYLLFQLKTHASFFSESEGDNQPVLSLVAALLVLTGITLVVAVSSECVPEIVWDT